jgi:adenylate cyclase
MEHPTILGDTTKSAADHAEAGPLRELRAWQRFHFRLTGLYGGAVALSLLLIAVIFYSYSVRSEIEHLQKRLVTTVTGLAASMNPDRITAIPVDSAEMTDFHKELRARLEATAAIDVDIQSIYVLRPTGDAGKLRFLVDAVKNNEPADPGDEYDATALPVLLAGFEKPSVENEPYRDEFGLTLSGYAPVRDRNGASIALVGADVEASRIDVMKREVLWVTSGVFGVAVVLLGAISIVVAHSVRQPLSRIIAATGAISRGELATRLGLERVDEFGLMSRHFDKMAEGLQEREFIRATFGRYVSEDVARKLLADRDQPLLGGAEHVVTVLFSDLASYSTICEHLPPAQLMDMLNEYLGQMNMLIDDHQGCVIEFLGDGILAVFGAPHVRDDHAQLGVRCALAMRERLARLNDEWRRTGLARCWIEQGVPELKARIGVHSGRVVAGSLGGATRMKYAVIGDAVNVAARLETLNKDLNTELLISAETHAQLPRDIAERFVPRGRHRVKGREQEVDVYAAT